MEETVIDITPWIEAFLFGFVGLGLLAALLGGYFSRQNRLRKIADMEEAVKALRYDAEAGCRYCNAWGAPPDQLESCKRMIQEQLPKAEERLRLLQEGR